MDLSRRSYLSVAGGAAGFVLAGCSEAGGVNRTTYDAPSVSVPDSVTSHLSETDNFEGTAVDLTGRDEVEVYVGTKGNEGYNAYSPAAIKISTGTTVSWDWARGNHNVVDTDGTFESDLGTDLTYRYTFEQTGVFTYYCAPHRGAGMKGAVIVE